MSMPAAFPRRPAALLLALLLWSDATRAGAFLSDLAWPEAAAALAAQVVVVPFAAGAKEHGPHLPLGTDRIVLEHLLAAAVREREVLIAPPILHGWFPAFRDYPGTEVADPTIFQDYARSVAESLVRHGATRLVFLNLGIGRATGLPLAIVARDLVADHGVETLLVNWEDLEDERAAGLYEQRRGGHADEGETAILLHLRPDLVRMERAVADYRDEPKQQIGYRPGRFERGDEVGVFGDPTLATAEKGAALLDIMTRNWLRALAQFAQ